MQYKQYSAAGLALTKQFEGLRLEAYQDSGGVWTVGYGHTGPALLAGMKISEADAEAMLMADLAVAVQCVNAVLSTETQAEMTQHQFDALVDFCYNIGCRNFRISSLLRYVNHGDFASAAQQFLQWVNVNGRRCEGLVRRRTAERALFLTPDAVSAEDLCSP